MSKMLDRIQKFLILIIQILFIVMVTIIFSEVILRYVFKKGFVWMEEVTQYLFIWQVMLASPIALRLGQHMSIDSLINMIPKKLTRIKISLMFDFLILVFLLIVAKNGFNFVINNWRSVSVGAKISMGYFYMAIPIGSILMLFFLLEVIIIKMEKLKHLKIDS